LLKRFLGAIFKELFEYEGIVHNELMLDEQFIHQLAFFLTIQLFCKHWNKKNLLFVQLILRFYRRFQVIHLIALPILYFQGIP
jgi:hypothetical protein